MLRFLKRVYRKFKRIFSKNIKSETYDFNKSNPLGDDGERVDIQINGNINFDRLDLFQKSHFRRYEFAKKIIKSGDVCGDFACGTGYGSIMLSKKASFVIGADLNSLVINTITSRYVKYSTVKFINEDLLNIAFNNYFDSVISFETLEHFDEINIRKLLRIFSIALKENGRLILSTPYMQEQTEMAIKMGFHLTFYINEDKLKEWFQEVGFKIKIIKYQNYETHDIVDKLRKKDFIICVATKQLVNA